MTNKIKNHTQLLEAFLKTIDISHSNYEKAEGRYISMGQWLEGNNSGIGQYRPDIYPQGSFALGTVVRPISGKDDYDLDLVCELSISKNPINQHDLKKIVGNAVKGYALNNNMKPPKEKNRCWQLVYADGANFHMDILPAIPAQPQDGTKINIPDRDLQEWSDSNPRGYQNWFQERMNCMDATNIEKNRLVESGIYAKVDDIPDYEVKTPLQQAIQILKRHRDIMFEKRPNEKPISIIITTLAAQAYSGESNIVDALLSVLYGMRENIEYKNGVAVVANPTNTKENFAEKWASEPEKEKAFNAWLVRATQDITGYLREADYNNIPKRFALSLNINESFLSAVAGSVIFSIIESKAAGITSDVDKDRANQMSQESDNVVLQTKPWLER